ncbi:glycosyltransferase family 2 protein [Cellulosimicrobium sp. CUA-896]|uniref:glycosyltransferase family 2 protein n=1 Tax=Cellulosimicrobium sp. CUA-896 TaxID=1517881 RepID=UPI0009666AD3|nr:glycosyltransferase family 2 protein [Cellulosimicrobium sp. CUA-896]OLT55445.1 hypothetical protein BJF88_06330 [Cellulosimicrobium sp. CUA-896]
MSARVRAVVVTWNGAHLLPPCLRSLLSQDLPGGLEVVVVDNASTDGTATLLAESFPSVRVVNLRENTGFAGGVAAGTEDLLAREVVPGQDVPEYVVLLNNDAWFEPGAVHRLVATADSAREAGERVGAVTAKVLLSEPDREGRKVLNSTGNILSPTGAATDRDFGVPVDQARPAREVFGLYGGACLIRTDALRDAGGFDARLFLYYEDTDLSWKLRERDWTVVYEGQAVAHHRHSASSGTASALFRYYNTRNSLVVATRHAPWGLVLRSLGRQLAGIVRHSALRTEPAELRRARRRALWDYTKTVPRLLVERRARPRAVRPEMSGGAGGVVPDRPRGR